MAGARVTVDFGRGRIAALTPAEAGWLRDELLKGEFGMPKSDLGIVMDESLKRLERGEATGPIEVTDAKALAMAWTLRGMLDADPQWFLACSGLVRLRDLLLFEWKREQPTT